MTGDRTRGEPNRALTGHSDTGQRKSPEDAQAASEGASRRSDGPLPAWVPTDDVIATQPDRQVLVVGETPTGLALAGLLRAGGYEPMLVGSADPPASSRMTYLPPAAMEVLGAIGVREALLAEGRRIEEVTVRWVGRDGERSGTSAGSRPDEAARAQPIVVPTPVLRRVLRDEATTGVDVASRTVASTSPDDRGVAVTFDDNVREWFDVVVDAGGSGGTIGARRRADPATLVQYETSTAAADPDAGGIVERWEPTRAIQRLGEPDAARRTVRITTPSTGRPLDELRQRVESGDGRSTAAELPGPDAFERVEVQQIRLPEGGPAADWWGTGRIARCGPAACPAPAAAGVSSAFGITDALGLVRALARDGAPVPEAIDAYRTGRARRFRELRRAVTDADRALASPTAWPEPLGSLYALRAMALEPFLGTAPAALAAAAGR